jgi:hypothetical protein
MKLAKYLWGLLVVVALAGGAMLLLRASRDAQSSRALPRPSSLAGPAVAGSQRELDALRQQVSRLDAEVRGVRSAVRESPGDPPGVEPAASAAPLSSEEQEEHWLAHVKEVDEAFRREPLNAGWAAEMTQKVRAKIAGSALTAGLVLDVECRSQSCKVDLGDSDARRLDRAAGYLIQELSSDLQNAAIGHNGDLTAPKPSALYLSQARPEDSVPAVARQ